MQWGICANPEQANALAEAGYDYLEWSINRTVGVFGKAEYAGLRQAAA